MELKKNPKNDLSRMSGMFLNLGLSVSLLLVIVAFEWRTYDDSGLLDLGMVQDDFEDLAKYICNKRTGFITFTINEQHLRNITYDVSMCDLEESPKNKLRKIIFREYSGLSSSEKMSIVGSLVGRSKRVEETDIYECMLDIHDDNSLITISGLAKALKCSYRTIHRNMSNELKKEKELLNQQIDEKI